jgi:predicted permease
MKQFLRKLFWLTQRSTKEADLRDELEFHLHEEAEEAQAAGLSPPAAASAAHRELGNLTLLMEDTRSAWGWIWLEQLIRDLRYSLRGLRNSPGFTAAAVLSLALGIGANAAIFSLLNAVVFRELPVSDPQRLVQFTYTVPIWETGAHTFNSYFSYLQYQRFQEQSTTLTGIFGGTSIGRVNVGFRGTSEIARGDAYTASLFAVLGIAPQQGRFYTPEEDRPDASVAVLSDRYWRRRFAADPSIVGRAITINQLSFTVVGVTPPEFRDISVGRSPDFWVPLHALDRLNPDRNRFTEPLASWMLIAGRLRPGASEAQAGAEAETVHRRFLAGQLSSDEIIARNLRRLVSESRLVLRPAATGVLSGLQDGYALPLKLLMVLAGIVLLVACVNLANLLLARASGRRREIAVRLALGAGRGRVVRQFLIESLMLAFTGGALALFMAWAGSATLVRMIRAGDSPLPLDVNPDWRMIAFTVAASLVTAMIFGLGPALRATRVDPGPVMKEAAGKIGRSSRALDRALMVAQLAFSVALILCAGLFVRTLQKLWNVQVGYDRENVLMFSVDARSRGFSIDRTGQIYREILDRLRTLPDVVSAGASIVRPVDDEFYLTDSIHYVDGQKLPDGESIRIAWNDTSPGYFSTVSTPIILGRDFEPGDDASAPKVVIINESLARRAFKGASPIGRRLDPATVIGVVKDSHYGGVREQPRPVLYHPMFQFGGQQAYRWGFVSFELRYRARQDLIDEVRREVASVAAGLPIFRVNTLRAQTEQSLVKERLLAMLSGFFGCLALLLVCVGL